MVIRDVRVCAFFPILPPILCVLLCEKERKMDNCMCVLEFECTERLKAHSQAIPGYALVSCEIHRRLSISVSLLCGKAWFQCCSVHENHRTHRTFPMARPKCLREISQIWIEYMKPIGQMSDEPWKFFRYTGAVLVPGTSPPNVSQCVVSGFNVEF